MKRKPKSKRRRRGPSVTIKALPRVIRPFWEPSDAIRDLWEPNRSVLYPTWLAIRP